METEMALNDFERRLIEVVRALPEAKAQQLLALAVDLVHAPPKPESLLQEERAEYGVSVLSHQVARDEEVQSIIQRSIKEHADVWAELAKR